MTAERKNPQPSGLLGMIDKKWFALNLCFYLTFYIMPMFLIPFLFCNKSMDYIIYSGIHSRSDDARIPGYKQQLPSSLNPHPLMVWPMGYLYDFLISRAFESVQNDLSLHNHSFIKVQFAIVTCNAFVNRLNRLIQIRSSIVSQTASK